jgi:O-antigen/teichoic acid export membrane protein
MGKPESVGRAPGRQAQPAAARVAKNTMMQGITYIARAVSTLIVTVFIARLAGVQSLGVYSFAITFTTAAALLADLGISLLLIREIARERDAVQKYLNNAFTISVFLSPIAFLAIAGTINLLGYPKDTVYAVYLSALALILFSFTALFKGAFYAHERMEFETATVVVQETAFLSLGLLVLYLGLPFLQIFGAYAVSRLLGLAFAWSIYRRYMGGLRLAFDPRFCKTLILKALPFGANVLLTLIYARSAVLLLSFFQGDEATGYYEAAFNLSIRLSIVAEMLNNSLLPIMSREHRLPEKKLLHYAALSIKYLVMLGLPLTVGLVLISDRIVGSVYGTGFTPSVLTFQILVGAIVFKFASHSLATALTAADLQGRRTVAVAIAASLNVALGLCLIPAYSYVGAAASVLATEVVLFVTVFHFARRSVGNPLSVQILWRPALGSLVMGGFISVMLDLPVAAVIVLGAIIYGGTLYLLRAFSADEIDAGLAVLRRARNVSIDLVGRLFQQG